MGPEPTTHMDAGLFNQLTLHCDEADNGPGLVLLGRLAQLGKGARWSKGVDFLPQSIPTGWLTAIRAGRAGKRWTT